MSELTPCNHCGLRAVACGARRRGWRVSVFIGQGATRRIGPGFDVYAHPRGLDLEQFSYRERKHFWRAWMWEISRRCVCAGDLEDPRDELGRREELTYEMV